MKTLIGSHVTLRPPTSTDVEELLADDYRRSARPDRD